MKYVTSREVREEDQPSESKVRPMKSRERVMAEAISRIIAEKSGELQEGGSVKFRGKKINFRRFVEICNLHTQKCPEFERDIVR